MKSILNERIFGMTYFSGHLHFKQGIKNRNSVLNRVEKLAIFCLKQGQGMRGCAAPPHPEIYPVLPPPPPGSMTKWLTQRQILNL